VAREVVVGLRSDLIAKDDRFWSLIEHRERQTFDSAARAALQDERRGPPLRGFWGWVERAMVAVTRFLNV
jgi:hypothetical protein